MVNILLNQIVLSIGLFNTSAAVSGPRLTVWVLVPNVFLNKQAHLFLVHF